MIFRRTGAGFLLSLLLLCAASASMADNVGVAEVPITVVLAPNVGPLPGASAVEIVATRLDRPAEQGADVDGGPPESAVRWTVPVSGDPAGDASLSFPVAGRWRVEIASDALWAESQELTIREGESPSVAIELHPLAWIRLTIASTPRPSTLSLELFPQTEAGLPSSPETRPRLVSCHEDEAVFLCRAPAGQWDIRTRTAAEAPYYFWSTRLEASKEMALGPVQLMAGAMVIGQVADTLGDPVAGASVRLSPQVAGLLPDTREQQRFQRLRRATETGERGLFQIHGLPQGAYEARVTREGFSTSWSPDPLLVTQATATLILPTLILARPKTLEVTVQPPTDLAGRPWVLELRSTDSRLKGREDRKGIATVAGAWLPGRLGCCGV